MHLQRPGLLDQVDDGVLVAAERQRRARVVERARRVGRRTRPLEARPRVAWHAVDEDELPSHLEREAGVVQLHGPGRERPGRPAGG